MTNIRKTKINYPKTEVNFRKTDNTIPNPSFLFTKCYRNI